MINIRQKGATAERDIADDLNTIINGCYLTLKLPFPKKPTVQRNQMQTAVGGKDLIGTFGLAIEVKRQEQLSINTWWRQCVASAKDLDEIPVLLFRQSKQPWRCITVASLPLEGSARSLETRCEINYDDFKTWFRTIVYSELSGTLKQPDHVRATESLFD